MSFVGLVSGYSMNLLFFTQVLTVLTSTIKYNEYITDFGRNITIPCIVPIDWDPITKVAMWFKQTTRNQSMEQFDFYQMNDLKLEHIQLSDSGIYKCLLRDRDDPMATIEREMNEIDYGIDLQTIRLVVRTRPGPVNRLTIRISTILGVLIWDYDPQRSGGYPLKSFTSEMRLFRPDNRTLDWERIDPINISPNVRYLEIYHLRPNTTYEFRIWANNPLGSGAIAYTTATTLSEMDDGDVLSIILRSEEPDFDPAFIYQIWLWAVQFSLASLIILTCTVLTLLWLDTYEFTLKRDRTEWDSMDLLPNIIMNPGYYESDGEDEPSPSQPYTRTIIFGEDVLSNSSDSTGPPSEQISFKRKFSLFFTGDTIKRL